MSTGAMTKGEKDAMRFCKILALALMAVMSYRLGGWSAFWLLFGALLFWATEKA